MSLRGFDITSGSVGANTLGDGREFALIANGVAVGDTLALETVYTVRRLKEAVALGIDADYDSNNKVNLYRHIKEFFRRAGEGIKLHLMVVAQTVMIDEMTTQAKTLATAGDGAIADMTFAFNPASDYTDTIVDGLNSDVADAIPVLQAFAEWCAENDMPLHTILEGRSMSETLTSITSLRELVSNYTKVSLIVGQDWTYADNLGWDLGKKFADVGTFMGVVASQAWNRNPGEVETQNLTDSDAEIWIIGGLSNHKKYIEVFEDLEDLDEKGYNFPIKYRGRTGYWWNGGHTCAEIVLDKEGNMNEHEIYYSHTMNMAKIALRDVYLDEVKKPIMLDDDGALTSGMVQYYNALGDNVFEELANQSLISDGETNTDSESDMLIAKQLDIEFGVIPTGCVNSISGTINLKASLS